MGDVINQSIQAQFWLELKWSPKGIATHHLVLALCLRGRSRVKHGLDVEFDVGDFDDAGLAVGGAVVAILVCYSYDGYESAIDAIANRD